MQPYENDIQESLKVFREHGILLYPTDTVWGLGCPADDELGIQKIFELKKRPANKSFILLMTEVKMLFRYLANPQPDLESLLQQFTEPTTIIYPNGINLPNSVLGPQGSIAVRITQDPFCRSLIKRIKKPLVSTSANFSGEPSTSLFQELHPELVAGADYVVQWRREEHKPAQPSTILAWQEDGSLLRLR